MHERSGVSLCTTFAVFQCLRSYSTLYLQAFFEELGFAQPLDVEPELDPYTENAVRNCACRCLRSTGSVPATSHTIFVVPQE